MQKPGSEWRPKPGVLAQTLGNEVVLLDANRGVYFSLNATGARAWQLLSEGLSFEQIRQALIEEFEVAADVLEADLKRLLDELAQNQLIEPGS